MNRQMLASAFGWTARTAMRPTRRCPSARMVQSLSFRRSVNGHCSPRKGCSLPSSGAPSTISIAAADCGQMLRHGSLATTSVGRDGASRKFVRSSNSIQSSYVVELARRGARDRRGTSCGGIAPSGSETSDIRNVAACRAQSATPSLPSAFHRKEAAEAVVGKRCSSARPEPAIALTIGTHRAIEVCHAFAAGAFDRRKTVRCMSSEFAPQFRALPALRANARLVGRHAQSLLGQHRGLLPAPRLDQPSSRHSDSCEPNANVVSGKAREL